MISDMKESVKESGSSGPISGEAGDQSRGEETGTREEIKMAEVSRFSD